MSLCIGDLKCNGEVSVEEDGAVFDWLFCDIKKKKKATDSLKDHTEKNVRGPSQAWHGDQEWGDDGKISSWEVS